MDSLEPIVINVEIGDPIDTALIALADVLRAIAWSTDHQSLSSQERLWCAAQAILTNLPPNSFAASLMHRLCVSVTSSEKPPKPDLRLVDSE